MERYTMQLEKVLSANDRPRYSERLSDLLAEFPVEGLDRGFVGLDSTARQEPPVLGAYSANEHILASSNNRADTQIDSVTVEIY